MAIKSVSISLFTISKTSFKISSSISTLGATIFTQVTRRSPAKKCFNLVGYFYNYFKQKFTYLQLFQTETTLCCPGTLHSRLAWWCPGEVCLGLWVGQFFFGIMYGTTFKKGSILACRKHIFAFNILWYSFQPQLGVVGNHLPPSPCDHGALPF